MFVTTPEIIKAVRYIHIQKTCYTPFSIWSNDNGRLQIICQEVMGEWLNATRGLYK
jgi:hypothetical protein